MEGNKCWCLLDTQRPPDKAAVSCSAPRPQPYHERSDQTQRLGGMERRETSMHVAVTEQVDAGPGT